MLILLNKEEVFFNYYTSFNIKKEEKATKQWYVMENTSQL